MKTLFIVRHAKSSWKDMSLTDWQRPLNKRGQRDAPAMGKRLKQSGVLVQYILSSTAVRAVHTAEFLAAAINFSGEIDVRDELYQADEKNLLATVQQIDETVNVAMLVAHNPGITDLVNRLVGQRIDNVPTCGIAMVVYDVNSWQKIGSETPHDFQFDYPKNK